MHLVFDIHFSFDVGMVIAVARSVPETFRQCFGMAIAYMQESCQVGYRSAKPGMPLEVSWFKSGLKK